MSSVINVKVNPKLKKQVQKVAQDLGLTLSAMINAYLKQVVRSKTVTYTTLKEIPFDYFIESLKEAEEDIKAGRVSPAFSKAEDAIAWLEDPNRKYAGKIQPEVQQTIR